MEQQDQQHQQQQHQHQQQQQQQQHQQQQQQLQQPIIQPSNGDDNFDEFMNNGLTFPYVVVKAEEDLDLNCDRDEKTTTVGGDGMLYLCDVCSDGFPTPLSLQTHKQQQHSNTICDTLIQQQQQQQQQHSNIISDTLILQQQSQLQQQPQQQQQQSQLQPQPHQQQQHSNSIGNSFIQQQQQSHAAIEQKEQYSNAAGTPFTGQYTPDIAPPSMLTVSEAKEESSTGFNDGTGSGFEARDGAGDVVNPTTASSTHNEFECNVCKLTFADEEYLRRHKVRCKDNSTSKFRCSWCDRGFTTKGSLELHVSAVHLKKKV